MGTDHEADSDVNTINHLAPSRFQVSITDSTSVSSPLTATHSMFCFPRRSRRSSTPPVSRTETLRKRTISQPEPLRGYTRDQGLRPKTSTRYLQSPVPQILRSQPGPSRPRGSFVPSTPHGSSVWGKRIMEGLRQDPGATRTTGR